MKTVPKKVIRVPASRQPRQYDVYWGRPSPSEVCLEIELLRSYKDRVRRFNIFGEDNRAAVSAQVSVLREGLSFNQIYDRYGVSRKEEQEGKEHSYLVHHAIDARLWLDGQYDGGSRDTKPSDGWKSLLKGIKE